MFHKVIDVSFVLQEATRKRAGGMRFFFYYCYLKYLGGAFHWRTWIVAMLAAASLYMCEMKRGERGLLLLKSRSWNDSKAVTQKWSGIKLDKGLAYYNANWSIESVKLICPFSLQPRRVLNFNQAVTLSVFVAFHFSKFPSSQNKHWIASLWKLLEPFSPPPHSTASLTHCWWQKHVSRYWNVVHGQARFIHTHISRR